MNDIVHSENSHYEWSQIDFRRFHIVNRCYIIIITLFFLQRTFYFTVRRCRFCLPPLNVDSSSRRKCLVAQRNGAHRNNITNQSGVTRCTDRSWLSILRDTVDSPRWLETRASVLFFSFEKLREAVSSPIGIRGCISFISLVLLLIFAKGRVSHTMSHSSYCSHFDGRPARIPACGFYYTIRNNINIQFSSREALHIVTLWDRWDTFAAPRKDGSPELSSRDIFVKPLAIPCKRHKWPFS